jgi:hypothetical protein
MSLTIKDLVINQGTTLRTIISGQGVYATSGSYTFIVPAGVTALSIVTVGGGGGGAISNGRSLVQAPTDGGDSTVSRGATILVGAGGGKQGYAGGHGGNVLTGTGFSGGSAGPVWNSRMGGIGGGAGGYTSAGETGGSWANDATGGGGGGVGLYGGTVGGSAGFKTTGGAGGSGGANASGGSGGAYGGGGGGYGYDIYGIAPGGGGGALAYANNIPVTPGEALTVVVGAAGRQEITNFTGYVMGGAPGGSGAVRIIWGAGRSFPSTRTGNY